MASKDLQPTTGRVCGICGKQLKSTDKINTDHIYPQAILKWVVNPGLETKQFIHNKKNQMFTHEGCNSAKNEQFFDIGTLHISNQKKDFLMHPTKSTVAAMQAFTELKQQLYCRQMFCYYKCGKRIQDVNKGVIRRIDRKLPRTEENGCLVCSKCNFKYAHFTK